MMMAHSTPRFENDVGFNQQSETVPGNDRLHNTDIGPIRLDALLAAEPAVHAEQSVLTLSARSSYSYQKLRSHNAAGAGIPEIS